MAIPISRPSIKRKDMDSVLSCMVSDTIGPDRISRQLVDAVGGYLNRSGGAALRELPRALRLALSGLGLQSGGRVVGSALLPGFYEDVLAEMGLELIPADVSETAPVVTVETVQQAIDRAAGESPAALIVDTALGFCPDLEGLAALGMPMIEDVSQGIGAHTGDRRAGSFGRYTVVGLEPQHVITAGGGALVLAAGRKAASTLRSRAEAFRAEVLLPDVNSALGLTQIKELERFIERRRELAARFSRALTGGAHKTPVQSGDGENVHYSFPVVLETGMKDVIAYARKHDVEAVSAFGDSILAGRSELQEELPVSRDYLLRCVLLPLYPLLKNSESERVSRVLSTLP
ncbi:MAG: DegT/DnrJ/EryC1/StrS family aminotransferase [Spirochaetaceae bacterium]